LAGCVFPSKLHKQACLVVGCLVRLACGWLLCAELCYIVLPTCPVLCKGDWNMACLHTILAPAQEEALYCHMHAASSTDCPVDHNDCIVQFCVQSEAGPKRLKVGLTGYPNVGKSSTINALFGSKKTAVAPTPGKTKHFQTLNVTEQLTLCDCPGLVLPRYAASKAEMVAAGTVQRLAAYLNRTTCCMLLLHSCLLGAACTAAHMVALRVRCLC
jgi:50S ribosome-binding GTPase